jgi:hypothetical protein
MRYRSFHDINYVTHDLKVSQVVDLDRRLTIYLHYYIGILTNVIHEQEKRIIIEGFIMLEHAQFYSHCIVDNYCLGAHTGNCCPIYQEIKAFFIHGTSHYGKGDKKQKDNG